MADANNQQPASSRSNGAEGRSAEFRARVEKTLALIRPSVQADDGDIELLSADPSGLIRIRFLGACVGCPSADMTLHHGIERALRTELGPTIRVEAVS
jgi:Fe-S cluster biogenesis protein NfuA